MRAAVDIGSNSVKFVVADEQRDVPKVLKTGSWVTRLGRGLTKGGLLSPISVAATRDALINMRGEIQRQAPKCDFKVVGTAALRDARNPEVIVKLVEEIFACPLRVLSGLEEARLSMQGAAAASERAFGDQNCIFIDVGGASTEVGQVSPHFEAHSFQAGAVRCHEALGLGQMPVPDLLWQDARQKLDEFFPEDVWKKLREEMDLNPARRAVAVGGSLLLAARLLGAPSAPYELGYLSSLKAFEELNESLRKLSLEERLKLPFMQEGRADILCAGILCLSQVLRKLGRDDVMITSWGLRYGLLKCWDEWV